MPVDAQESHVLTLRAGALLADRFRVVRSAHGASPFAFSYHAEDLLNGDAIVIKEFFPRSLVSRAADGLSVRAHSPECERDFLRALHRFALEGAVLAEIAHPHVARVRAVVDANQTVYLVMDRHETQSLADFVQANQGKIAPADAGRIIQQLLSALELLHAESIIHRDLSPRTVHVTESGAAMLLEFSARRHLPMHATDLAAGFAAFEQYGTKDIGPWTDVYAVSALFCYLLTGTTPPSALERAAGAAVASPLMAVPGLASGLAGLVMRGMALLPQQRPHAVSELRRQLEGALAERSGPARPAYAPPPELVPRMEEDHPLESAGGTPLRLAAGGIVVPGEESGSTKLFRMLKSAASRIGGNPTTVERPHEIEQIEALARAVASSSATAAPPRPTIVEERPAPFVGPPTFAPIVPAADTALPVTAETTRFDLVPQTVLIEEDPEETTSKPSITRRRYSLAAAALLVVGIGSSMILLARSSRASGVRTTSNASASQPHSAALAVTPVAPAHESVDGGAVLQSTARTQSTAEHPAVDSPTSFAKRSSTPERSASPAPSRASEAAPAVLPTGRLPTFKIALPGSATDLKLVPPELLVDTRTRLTNGQDQAEQGDYAVARRTFKTSLAQVDSIAARYPDSQSIKSLRREIEQADARALQACTAENEMHKRRGEEARACQ